MEKTFKGKKDGKIASFDGDENEYGLFPPMFIPIYGANKGNCGNLIESL